MGKTHCKSNQRTTASVKAFREQIQAIANLDDVSGIYTAPCHNATTQLCKDKTPAQAIQAIDEMEKDYNDKLVPKASQDEAYICAKYQTFKTFMDDDVKVAAKDDGRRRRRLMKLQEKLGVGYTAIEVGKDDTRTRLTAWGKWKGHFDRRYNDAVTAAKSNTGAARYLTPDAIDALVLLTDGD